MNDQRYAATDPLRAVEGRVFASMRGYNPHSCRPLKFVIESPESPGSYHRTFGLARLQWRESFRWMMRPACLLTAALAAALVTLFTACSRSDAASPGKTPQAASSVSAPAIIEDAAANDAIKQAAAALSHAEGVVQTLQRQFERGEASRHEVEQAERNLDAKDAACRKLCALLPQPDNIN